MDDPADLAGFEAELAAAGVLDNLAAAARRHSVVVTIEFSPCYLNPPALDPQ